MRWPSVNRVTSHLSEIRSKRKPTALFLMGIVSISLIMLPGCVVVGGYSPERGWFLWPGTIVIFLVTAVLFFLLRRRR
jgi:hypothetical protein